MHLNYKPSGTGPPLIILHGLFGMLDNWKTVGKGLEDKFTIYLVDQRNHGKSPHVDAHSYKLMAEDIREFFEYHHIKSAHIIGHSMGGKTAMQFALDHGEMVNKLIVVDMGIKRYVGGHDKIFDALMSLDIKSITSRKDAESLLIEKVADTGVRQFLLKGLTRNANGSYDWKFNLKALSENYDEEILGPVVSDKSFQGKTLFIRGENSDYILNDDWDVIQKLFPNSRLITIKNAGHWVHADQPEALIKTVELFLLT
ncbi:MAG: alpha/beta fold hydrolase [Chitinophagales bacterium]